MATPVLNNGIFLRDTSYKASSHVDSYHLTQMLGNAEPMDMGPVDLWAMTQKVEMPLYQMASFGGKNTNLLGHLLEKYQFVEPNYTLISEALWLLQDPEGYKAKIMDKGAQKSVEQTVRKLKTAAASNSSASLGIHEKDSTKRKPAGKKLPRTNNIFKRI